MYPQLRILIGANIHPRTDDNQNPNSCVPQNFMCSSLVNTNKTPKTERSSQITLKLQSFYESSDCPFANVTK